MPAPKIKRKVPPKPPSTPGGVTKGGGSAASASPPKSKPKSPAASTPLPGKGSPPKPSPTSGPAFVSHGLPILKPVPPRIIALAYGAPGTAKTPLITTLPKAMWPLLFINIDAGGENMDSVFDRHTKLPVLVDGNNLPLGPPSEADPWNMVALTAPVDGNIWDWLVQVLTWPDWESKYGIRTVVFDGFSTAGKYILTLSAQSQQYVSDKKKEKGEGTPSIGTTMDTKFFQPDRGDYGLAQGAVSQLRMMMTSRQWNVVAAAHQSFRTETVDNATVNLAGPETPGKAIMQTFGAEWSQFLRTYADIPFNQGGQTTTILRAQLAQSQTWPARVRKGPNVLDKQNWRMEYDHHRLWQYIIDQTGIELRHGEPLPCYAEMLEGCERGDVVERDANGAVVATT